MAIKSREEEENLRDESHREDGESEPDASAFDDSDEDPTFDVLEETRSSFSRMALKKTRPRVSKKVESGSEEEMEAMGTDVSVPQLDEKDEKCFEKVEEIIKDGKLDKLKVNQCKVYLRKHGLRLTGSKEVLMERIREHLEVVDGGGEKKYPTSSFELNCKGDACTGDLVIFEQNVYEMFSIASRSATGPPCGTRIVAGRIVKESYGAAKQQHTFTIEVLWSKGEKPLPPLHPLLIKGRNLYRLKTMRQRWADEGERWKVLQEKHMRGSFARGSREQRIQEKEFRKMSVAKRPSLKCTNVHRCNNISRGQENPPQPNPVRPAQNQHHDHNQKGHCNNSSHVLEAQSSDGAQVLKPHNQNAPQIIRPTQNQHHYHNACTSKENTPHQKDHWNNSLHVLEAQTCDGSQVLKAHNQNAQVTRPQSPVQPYFHAKYHGFVERSSNYPSMSGTSPRNQEFHGRRIVNYSSILGSPTNGHLFPRQHCRFYRQGRCYYGDSCKYLHETRGVEKRN